MSQDTSRTPESDYSKQTVRGKGMRTGYTTGSCAASAAKAAVTAFITSVAVTCAPRSAVAWAAAPMRATGSR